MATSMPTRDQILNAARRIRDGKLVAFPTETVYGLGADATNGLAVAEIFAAKGRPEFNPLIVHVATLHQARRFAEFSPSALSLAKAFWPGPLSLVLPLKEGNPIAPLVTAGLETIAVRQPDHPVAQDLIIAAERPLAAPSANLSGHVSATTAEHVATDFRNIDLTILDGGPTAIGLESTIVRCIDGTAEILRTGAITDEELKRHVALTEPSPLQDPQKPSAPGQLASHYAPSVPLRLDARHV
ncbi:MAG: L-threonylcarbamoyladenylate synthase, partial [Methyloligellaceae bacterium]